MGSKLFTETDRALAYIRTEFSKGKGVGERV